MRHSKITAGGLIKTWEHAQNLPAKYSRIRLVAGLSSGAKPTAAPAYGAVWRPAPSMLRISCTDTELIALTLIFGCALSA